jgi:hypothetical protein
MDGARRSPARPGRREAPTRPEPSSPCLAPNGRISGSHTKNIKSVPAGSNPSKRHLADRWMIAPSDQEPSKGRSTQASLAAVDSGAASLVARD